MAATMPLMNATPLAKATSVAKEPTPARPPDELLVTVQAAKQGNTTAQMLLMDRLRLPMERQIRRLRRSFRPSEAEDARQEVQRLFLELLYEYDYTRNGNFEAYMCTMLKWRVHNFGRTSRRTAPPDPAHNQSLSNEITAYLAEKRLRAGTPTAEPAVHVELDQALQMLTPKQKSVLYAIYWQDRRVVDIAARMGVSPQAVRAIRQRAEKILRQRLEASGAAP
jgi:RNA polymerase sigma factor (sigma-70 family)